MIASLHLADFDRPTTLKVLRTRLRPGPRSGLRFATTMLTAPLSTSLLPRAEFRRVGLLAIGDTEDNLETFLAKEPLVDRFAGGWHTRLAAVRAAGEWPGLTDQPPDTWADAQFNEPAIVVTLGRLRLSQTVRFLRASARAEAQAMTAPGFLWGTALARPPFVATCSLWQDTATLAAYAHRPGSGHAGAISGEQHKPFHHKSAFLRFRPLQTSGLLTGRNPLAADTFKSPSP